MSENLQVKEELVQHVANKCNREDILSLSRCIGVNPNDFDSDVVSIRQLSERFITRAFQLGREDDLIQQLTNRKEIGLSKLSVSDKSAEIFGELLNLFLDGFNDIDEKDFEESELFNPIEFEEKMRNKAHLSEDIVRAGINIKSDVTVLRRKAYALDYKKYNKLIQKLARYYMHTICVLYPVDQYDSSKRFSYLFNALLAMIPSELYERDVDIEDKVEGIIFDTISKCLIFNE